jgi:hypothetical protein
MPRVRCHYIDCVFIEDGFCGMATVEIDPDEGCRTYRREGDIAEDEDWDEEQLDGIWDAEDELYSADEEPDDWLEVDD